MEDRVILNIMNHVFFTTRKIPLQFRVDILIGSVSGRGVSRRGVLGGRWGFLTGDMENRVIPDVMNQVFYPKEDILKIWC